MCRPTSVSAMITRPRSASPSFLCFLNEPNTTFTLPLRRRIRGPVSNVRSEREAGPGSTSLFLRANDPWRLGPHLHSAAQRQLPARAAPAVSAAHRLRAAYCAHSHQAVDSRSLPTPYTKRTSAATGRWSEGNSGDGSATKAVTASSGGIGIARTGARVGLSHHT